VSGELNISHNLLLSSQLKSSSKNSFKCVNGGSSLQNMGAWPLSEGIGSGDLGRKSGLRPKPR